MLKYEHELDMETDNSPSIILRQIKQGSSVLELGPATGYMTRYMKEQLQCTICCVELDPNAAERAAQYSDKMIVGNLEELQWARELKGMEFDYVVFADVLEHLRNPIEVLAQAAKFLKADGVVITSVPNIAHNAIVMELLDGKFDYKELGLLDSTHVTFFTKKSMLDMHHQAGLKPVKLVATVVGPEQTEFRRNYEDFSEDVQRKLIQNIEGHVYQYITLSKRSETVNDSELEESIEIIEDRYNQLQIYWNKDGLFTEENSVKHTIYYDGEFHSYQVEIPTSFEGQLRIDPGNWSSSIKLRSVKLINVTENTEESIVFQEATAENEFKNLKAGSNVLLTDRKKMFSVFSLSKDPQLFLDVNIADLSNKIGICIEMSAERGEQVSEQLNQFAIAQSNQLSTTKTILGNMKNELSYLTGEHNMTVQELVEVREEMAQMESRLQHELDRLQNQLTEEVQKNHTLSSKVISKEAILTELEQKYNVANGIVHQMQNSRSWRLTSPLRNAGKFVRSFKRKIVHGMYAILRKRFEMHLRPIHYLEPIFEKGWKSIGSDPAFQLEGKFPTGWVVMGFTSSSRDSIPLKLYWDSGSGMNEQQNLVIGRIAIGEQREQEIVFSMPLEAKALRLDPGEKETEFELSDLYFRKISGLHLLYYAYKKQIKIRGGSIRFLFQALSKIARIYKTSGSAGVWHKIKIVLGLNQENILGQDYQQWVELHRIGDQKKAEIEREISDFKYRPLISIVVPVYNVDEVWLRKCIESVRNQIYDNWELCIADDASPKPHIKEVLQEYTSKDPRIKVLFREQNGHISESSNSALEIANGEFIGLLDNDDELTMDALYENVKLLNEHPDADMIYSDEDKISVDGERHSPFFKPHWSPDLLLTHMYTCHFGVYRAELIRKIGGFRKGYEGSQDFDLALRITELTDHIYHIPKILYHWRTIPESTASGPGAKNYTHYAGLKAVEDALARRNVSGWIEELEGYSNFYRVHYNNEIKPLVSIIIPTRDGMILGKCLDSIIANTVDQNIEIILVDNGSKKRETLKLFDDWSKKFGDRFKVITLDIPFNYAKLNNTAAEHANGELLLFLNDDIEILSPTWFDDMVGQAMRSNIGAVGAFLMYPDGTIQHSGLTLGLGSQRAAGDGHHYRPVDDPGYFGAMLSVKNVSAVTAACLMVKKSVFEEVDGLDENLTVAYNDVDFCIKIREKGYLNLWLPYVQMIHHESKTRGSDQSEEKLNRLNAEADYLRTKWGDLLINDPYYSQNLSLDHGYSVKV
ncbi:Chondroitin synthase [compost metagenome]